MRICAVQPAMSADPRESAAVVERWARAAAAEAADLVVFPEMMLTGYDAHLHGLFARPDWYGAVQEELRQIQAAADRLRTRILVGAPLRADDGYLNALMLCEPGGSPRLAGARSLLVLGWREVFGFVAPERRDPIAVGGVAIGAVFCAEAAQTDQLRGQGLETSDVIVWVGVVRSHLDAEGQVVRDNCREGAAAIAGAFDAAVIQSNYVTQVRPLGADACLGGSAVCSPTGAIACRASFRSEGMLVVDVGKGGDLQAGARLVERPAQLE